MASIKHLVREIFDLTIDEELPAATFLLDDKDKDANPDSDDDVEFLGETRSRESSLGRSRANKISLTSVLYHDMLLKPGMDVELVDYDFLRIRYIFQDTTTNKVYLQGNLFRRNLLCDAKLPWKLNDICMRLEIRSSSGLCEDASPQECMSTRSCEEVITIRRIIITNQDHPAFTCQENRGNKPWRKENGELVCRWILREVFNSNNKQLSESMQRPTEAECDPGKAASVVRQIQKWTGKEPAQPASSRSAVPVAPKAKSVGEKRRRSKNNDLTSDDEATGFSTGTPTKRTKSSTLCRPRPQQSSLAVIDLSNGYLFGDICAGGGGIALGADRNNLDVVFTLDYDKSACDTLRMRFPRRVVLQEAIHEFCAKYLTDGRAVRVDVLHISFPCQPHSAAHTIAGKNDDANIATAYSVLLLLKITRPRIVTFEQTSGIVTHNGAIHYHALLNQITSVGYSYRAKICVLNEYGLSQPRKRLIIIAACPGETLPPFPKPTHGLGLRPYTTIKDALDTVPRHYPAVMHNSSNRDQESTDPNIPLARCITTNGGGSIHPSGKRTFNCQELAALQSFPGDYRFAGSATEIRRQIGNAVPPVFAEKLFSTIIKSMRETDRKIEEYKPEVSELDLD